MTSLPSEAYIPVRVGAAVSGGRLQIPPLQRPAVAVRRSAFQEGPVPTLANPAGPQGWDHSSKAAGISLWGTQVAMTREL